MNKIFLKSYINEYFQKMDNGDIRVGKWIYKIFKIIVEGIQDEKWFYDEKKAKKAIKFVENFCHHSNGRSDLIKLELWQ